MKSMNLSEKLKHNECQMNSQLNKIDELSAQLLDQTNVAVLVKKDLCETKSELKTLTKKHEAKVEKLLEIEGQMADIKDGHQNEIASLSSRLIEMKSKYERTMDAKVFIETRLNDEITAIKEEKSRLEEVLVSNFFLSSLN